MNEQNNLSSFANDYGNFTSIQRVPDNRHPQSNAVDMADVGSAVFVTCSTLAITFAIRKTLRSQKFQHERALFRKQPVLVQAAVASSLFAAVVIGGLKPESATFQLPAASPIVMLMDATQGVPLSESLQFTENQKLAGFALTAVVTNETFDLSAPSNAVIHANWLKRGAAEDGFWVPVGPFCLGTNRYESVYVSSSGTLSFTHPKSSPTALMMPDDSSIAFLAPLQTVLGIPPESRWELLSATNSLLWYDVTDSGSTRFTWQNALLGRETNAPLSFQAELFTDGDFIYRYDFSSLTPSTLPLAPDLVIGAQNSGGGETVLISTGNYHCTPTNHLCASLYSLGGTNVLTTPLCSVATNSPKFSLHWTAFGDLDLDDPDPDDDGITTVDEVLIHHTDPNMLDSDLDGISDGDEIASGTNPLDPDSDNDGIPDGIDNQPLTWNDAQSDLDGDGLSLAEELLYGLDPAVANNVDTDGDGWEDWKEVLAGTSPTDYGDNPWNGDGSAKIFDVTFTLGSSSGTPVLIAVGDHRMVFGASVTSRTLTLREGIAQPVSLYATTDCSADVTAVIDSDFAVFQNPHPVFTGGGTLSGGRTASSGMIAQPVPSIDPERICFHSHDDIHVKAAVLPEGMPGNWSWWVNCEPWDGTGDAMNLPYVGGAGWMSYDFLSRDMNAPRRVSREVTYCSLLEEHPEWLESDIPEQPGAPSTGEFRLEGSSQEKDGNASPPFGTLVPANNDDDDANANGDDGDSEMSTADNDLIGYYPFGWFTGQCCPCSEHRPRYAQNGTLVSTSTRLTLYSDAFKSNNFAGTIYAGEPIYVEGMSKSPSVGSESLVWEYVDSGLTHQVTNIFTVLSLRIFGDRELDGTIDAGDKAPLEHGFCMPIAPDVLRIAQLRTDVNLPGQFTLSLSGDLGSFRIWQTPTQTNNPLLVCGQTVTNGVDGVCFLSGSESNIYIEHSYNGRAMLNYVFEGTGVASGIVCRAGLELALTGVKSVEFMTISNSVPILRPWSFVILDNDPILLRLLLTAPVDSLDEFLDSGLQEIVVRCFNRDALGHENSLTTATLPINHGTAVLTASNEVSVAILPGTSSIFGLVSKTEDNVEEFTSIDSTASPTGDSNRGDSDAFDAGAPGVMRGRSRGDGDPDILPPEGKYSWSALQAAGTRLVTASCLRTVSEERLIQEQADIVYYSGHGSHASAGLTIGDPESVSNHWEDVDVFVIAGCAVLDINDYENHYPIGGGHEDSPGEKWEPVGPNILLGYNYKAPYDSQGSAGIITTWLTQRGESEVDDVEAWRDANENSNGRNACAIKKGESYHYFQKIGFLYRWVTIPKAEW